MSQTLLRAQQQTPMASDLDQSYGKHRVQTGTTLVQTNLNSKKNKESLQINREQIVMKNLLKFYSLTSNLEQLLNVLQKRSKISLRILDWFVTNYAKEYRVVYNITKYGRTKQFNVYQSYKAQLKAYHKKLFDPFCRHRRIFFEYSDDSEIETTVGQLNFFQWAISYKVLDYVAKHLHRITDHMAIKGNTKIDSNSVYTESNLETSELSTVPSDEYTEPLPQKSKAPGVTIQATASQEGPDTVVQVDFTEQ